MKIALVGPESVGKSTLARWLARTMGGVCVDEYAREYVERLSRACTYEDVITIAERQVKQLTARYDAKYVFFDTDLIITKVWMEEVFGKCEPFVDEHIKARHVDFYLLLKPDIEFVEDPVRVNPTKRDYLYERYKQVVEVTGVPYAIVDGKGEKRFENARDALTCVSTQGF